MTGTLLAPGAPMLITLHCSGEATTDPELGSGDPAASATVIAAKPVATDSATVSFFISGSSVMRAEQLSSYSVRRTAPISTTSRRYLTLGN
jgi:hypothetical protein